jgi:hypothetical protein
MIVRDILEHDRTIGLLFHWTPSRLGMSQGDQPLSNTISVSKWDLMSESGIMALLKMWTCVSMIDLVRRHPLYRGRWCLIIVMVKLPTMK